MKISNKLLMGCLLTLGISGCSASDACEGAACAEGNAGGGGGGPEVCTPWLDPNACMAGSSCPAAPSLQLAAVETISTRADANPEIVDFIPGTDDRAVVVSAVANQVSELLFTETGVAFGREEVIDTGSDTSNMTSIKVHPSGEYAAVTVMEEDCVEGQVLFVDMGEEFGAVLAAVPVGYGPDSSAFSADGNFLVSANEDDREDHPCKPTDRMGGSISVIDLAAGPESAAVVQTIPVDHALDSEPEGVAIAPDGTVLVAVQETSELVRFSLADVPNAVGEIIALSAGAEPDGMAISKDGKWAVIGYEAGDALAVMDMQSGQIVSEYVIRNSGDVPESYNRDEADTTHLHEPEGNAIFSSQGQLFVASALQESHALIAYGMGDDGNLSFDSIAPSGVGWQAEEGGREKSEVGPEGIAVHPGGMILVANERESTITLFHTAPATLHECPEE
jgi:DNA-binding beta-propeller fold protein YncE